MESIDPESESELELIDEGDLESEVREMAKKISEYRKTLPDHLRNTLLSSSRRPVSPNIASGSDLLPSSSKRRLTVAAETQVPLMLGNEDRDCEEKMIQLKERLSRNAENIPKVIKRVRECAEAIHKLHSLNTRTIHPAFPKRRIN